MFARSGILWLAAGIFHAVIAVACVEVNGGAVELSWTLRDFEGKPIPDDDGHPCEVTNIEWIRLHWQAVGGDAGTSQDPPGDKRFRCRGNRGITDFTIPAGRQMLWIEPVCSNDMVPAENYEVPPPIVREVEEGTVTTLDALLIVADRERTCPAAISASTSSEPASLP